MKILPSFLIVITFISIIPIPKKFMPVWNDKTLRYFCVMLPVSGLIFGVIWQVCFDIINLTGNLKGLIMMLLTLALTGGLHMDGFMDTCDAIFSHRDRETKLKILSDTHAGSFAVIGCVIILLAKTLLFAEIVNSQNIFIIPVYSRLGMAILLNNLPFAKSDGLAVTLGKLRRRSDNFYLLIMMLLLAFVNVKILVIMLSCLACWGIICVKIFGGITGDLLGAFVEISEVIMLIGSL